MNIRGRFTAAELREKFPNAADAFIRMNASDRFTEHKAPEQPVEEGCEHEKELHHQIMRYCERRGWVCLHGSMAHKAYRTVGEFDFVILAAHGRVFLIECKTKRGKLTVEQEGLQRWALNLGHYPHVVRSYQQFLTIVEHYELPNAPKTAAGTTGPDS